MSGHAVEPVAVVFVSWGLWVAACPRDGCRGSEHFGHVPGVTQWVGGLTSFGFVCARCQLVCHSQWPDNADDIWYVLTRRPIWETRNWKPGETLEDLIVENALHGIITPGLRSEDGGIEILGDRLTDRPPVAAGSRFQIGV